MSTKDELKTENALLKHKLGRLLGAEQEWELVEPGEYARLKAEVERLKQELKDEKSANANVEGRMQSANLSLSMTNHNLKAEVERLTKLCQATSPDGFIHIRDIKHLNAAKEGKPSDDDEDNRNRGGFNPRK